MQKEHISQQIIHIALDNVRSAYNVGSIFRTADAVGVAHIYLIGYTPAPIDRFGRTQPDIKKTALGAEKNVAWTHVDTHEAFLKDMRARGVCVVAVEQDSRARNYTEIAKDNEVVFVFGNEVEGVSDILLEAADDVIELPMCGEKESLNVSVAAGIALYQQRFLNPLE